MWRLGKVQQRFVHLGLQQGEVREVLEMRRHLLDFLPQIFNWIEIWRIGGQLHLGQACDMGRKKRLHSFAGVVTRSILHDKDMLRGLGQNIEQKGRIALRIESTCMGFGEKASRAIVNQSKDLIGLTNATGGDFRLMSPGGPGVAQGAPLGKAGLITKEQQGLPLAGAP